MSHALLNFRKTNNVLAASITQKLQYTYRPIIIETDGATKNTRVENAERCGRGGKCASAVT